MRNAAGIVQGVLAAADLRAAGEAGGYITQIDMHADGTKLIAGDTLQPLTCTNADPVWKQILTESKKPSGFGARSSANASAGKRDQEGCTGAAIAPSDSSRWYLCQEAVILVCTGRGATVTMSPQVSYTSLANTKDPRIAGPYLVVHPTDPNRVMWGVAEGLIFSTDGFTTSKGLTAGIPAAQTRLLGGENIHTMVLVGFDPSNTAVAYAHSWGNGLYRSSNALSATPTFTLVSGSPTTAKRMRVGANGKVWMTDSTGGLWTYNGTSVTQSNVPAFNWHDIAIDPANTQRIVVMNEVGQAAASNDGGVSWINSDKWAPAYPSPVGIATTAIDVPYLGVNSGVFDVGGILFDPSASNKLYSTTGLGVQWTNFPSNFTRIDWYTQSRGIRQLIPYSAISPPGGKPLWSGQDRPTFILRDSLDQSAINYGPRAALTDGSPSLNHGWHLTYSPQDPTYVLAQVNYTQNTSGYSTDGGATFTPFANKNCVDGRQGGAMAVSANKDQILCAPGNNGAYAKTLDRGATAWGAFNLPGMPAGHSAGQFAYFMRRQSLAVDAVTAGTFLLCHPGVNNDGSLFNTANAGWFSVTGGLANAPVRLSTGYPIPGSFGSGYACHLEGIPGMVGHFLFAGDSDNQGLPMRRTRNVGVSFEDVPVSYCTTFSYGAAAPGSSFLTCWAIGTYNGVYGIHYSTDDLATWRTFPGKLGDEWSNMAYICADRNEFGLIYVGIDGKAWLYARLTDRKLIV